MAVGEGVGAFAVGDRVWGFNDMGLGSHAECFVAPAERLAPMPEGVGFSDAVAGIEGAFYAYNFLNKVEVTPEADGSGLGVRALVKTTGQTGVEMEALTAVSVACLTVYDMLKAADKSMTIEGIRLLEKRGGKSGDYVREAP